MSDRALSQLLADQYHHAMVAARRRGPVWSVTDLGELAARLGSIVTFDRRGDVVFLDGFEDGLLKWGSTCVGTGASVALSHEAARSGGWSVLLTAGSDGSRYATIAHRIPFPVLSAFGLVCSFRLDVNLDTLTMAMSLFNGSVLRTAAVRYDYPGLLLQYMDAAGDYHDLATDVDYLDLVTGLDLFSADAPFWTWKVVADFENGEYVRVIMNEAEFDLSGIPLREVDSTVIPLLEVWIMNRGIAGENGAVFVDDVVVTQNEPENE